MTCFGAFPTFCCLAANPSKLIRTLLKEKRPPALGLLGSRSLYEGSLTVSGWGCEGSRDQ